MEESMSLDVYLILEGAQQLRLQNRIVIRENGMNREISRQEWDARWPGREPVVLTSEVVDDSGEVYSANITHNLNGMATAAGIYEYLWRPDEHGITTAAELIEPLRAGLACLRADPDGFRKFNPPNGWGTYESLVQFVADYLAACERWPDASVYASR
jgi:hypothetical protein